MKEFKEYIRFELGVDEITEQQESQLKNALEPFMDKLQTQEYRLLSLDNFVDSYGEESDLLVKIIDCDNWFDIAMYKTSEKKVVGYGINISYKNTTFERVATFSDENIAKEFYHSLALSEEIKNGAKIELEKIYEVDGRYEYDVVLRSYKSTIKVTIEEHISKTFDVEAENIEEAMQLAEERYYSGEYALVGEINVTAKLMSADDGNGDCTEWTEF